MDYSKEIFEDADNLLLESYANAFMSVLEKSSLIDDNADANAEKKRLTKKMNEAKKNKDHKGVLATLKEAYMTNLKKGGVHTVVLIGLTALAISTILALIAGAAVAGVAIYNQQQIAEESSKVFSACQDMVQEQMSNVGQSGADAKTLNTLNNMLSSAQTKIN